MSDWQKLEGMQMTCESYQFNFDGRVPENVDVLVARDDEIYLDLDSAAAVARFDDLYLWLRRYEPFAYYTQWASKGGNTHVVITLTKSLPLLHRVSLAYALGSDPLHVVMSLARGTMRLFKPK